MRIPCKYKRFSGYANSSYATSSIYGILFVLFSTYASIPKNQNKFITYKYRLVVVRFLALVTTMVTKVDHSNHRSNDRSNHRGYYDGYYDRY